MQAIQAATAWAAECLGVEREIGTVEAGKAADLVVVSGDPLLDIKILQRLECIRLVLKGGMICVDRRTEAQGVRTPR
jgi:imidazolonepropionase-like amidohydrolase